MIRERIVRMRVQWKYGRIIKPFRYQQRCVDDPPTRRGANDGTGISRRIRSGAAGERPLETQGLTHANQTRQTTHERRSSNCLHQTTVYESFFVRDGEQEGSRTQPSST